MRCLVICHPVPKDIKRLIKIEDSDYIIAVDQAVSDCYKQRIKMDLAVGDFDSLKNEALLKKLNVLRLNPIKDVTDTYQALVEANKKDPEDFIMIGGIGGSRIEHFMVHLMFFNEFPNLLIKDENSTIRLLTPGSYRLQNDNRFISLFAYPVCKISMRDFKYELDHYLLKTYDPLCISNEIIKEEAILTIHEGKAIMVQSNK